MVARIKYRNVRAVVPWLAARMAESIAPFEHDAAVISWAPTTPERRRTRGVSIRPSCSLAQSRVGSAARCGAC